MQNIGIGLIGAWGNKIVMRGTLQAKAVKMAVTVDTIAGPSVVYLPVKTVRDRNNAKTYYVFDELTHGPVMSFRYWSSNGSRITGHTSEAAYFQGDGLCVDDSPTLKAGPGILRAQPKWQCTDDPSDVLQLLQNTWVPSDEVEYVEPEQWADAMLSWDAAAVNRKIPRKVVSGGRTFYTRALFGGVVTELLPAAVKISNGVRDQWYKRPRGAEYTVALGYEVAAETPLFDLRTAEPGSEAWHLLVSVWRTQMFRSFGNKEYVKASFISALPYRCPLCFKELEKGEKCGGAHHAYAYAQPLITEARIEFTERRYNYTGDLEHLQSFMPDISKAPEVVSRSRKARRAIAKRKAKATICVDKA